jgi:3-oxoadipate enol-lactonase
MPFMTASDGCSIHYRFEGEEGRPVVVLSNSLGARLEMWESQIASLIERYRVLLYDNRGHGQSDVPPAPYTLERIATDARELIAELDLGPVLWCGLSLGGMVGMWLGANAPHTLKRAVLANTSARVASPEVFDQRIVIAETLGMEEVAKVAMQRWLTPSFAAEHPKINERLTRMIAETPKQGYIGAAGAVRDTDLRDSLSRITIPVLVIAGSQDLALPYSMGEHIAASVVGARFAILEAAHLSNVEQPEEFNRLVRNFFDAA